MPAAAMEQMQDVTPEQAKAGMEQWMVWANQCGDGLVDLGSPLGGAQRVTQSGSSPSDSNVVGYSILQAENMEAAQALLQGHPHIAWNAACESKSTSACPCRDSWLPRIAASFTRETHSRAPLAPKGPG